MDSFFFSELRIAILFSLIVPASCKKVPAEDRLSRSYSSAHFNYHLAAGDTVDSSWMEQYYSWLLPRLEINNNERLEYFKYRNRDHLKQVTGKTTNGFAEPGTLNFHTIWPIDNHECVHALVIKYMGHPPALFNEGIAVACQTDPASGILLPRWNQVQLDVLARQFKQSGQIPVPGNIIESADFFSLDDNKSYPLSGSFVHYLINTHGLSRLKIFFASVNFGSKSTETTAKFQTAYGFSLDTAWQQWLSYLN